MRILILCKRRPQGRDLFTQPYGRFYHLPRLLAEDGHEVHMLLLGYQREPAEYRQDGNLHWHTISALPWGPQGYVSRAHQLARELTPDWIIGFSDTWYGILAQSVAAACGTRSLIDAYDNYESYIPWLKPLHWFWHRALRRADAVTAAGPQLAELLGACAGNRKVEVIPMAADPNFSPLPKKECRQLLGLPIDGILVGYTGALNPNRGINLLFATFEKLRESVPQAQLVLSGRLAEGVRLPEKVHWLEYRPPEQVSTILNSLDLLFVLNMPGAFGNFSYPAKLYEAMRCEIPVVASDVPATAWILRKHSQLLARAGNAEDFSAKAVVALSLGRYNYSQAGGWEESAGILSETLQR